MIPNDLSAICSDEDFMKYFIYFYEYTFAMLDEQNYDIKEHLKELVDNNTKYKNYRDLWIYCYLQISLQIIDELPLESLKDSIQKMSRDFLVTDKEILDIQLDLLDDTLQTLGLISLEIRPYEQLYRNSTFGKFMLTKENTMCSIFNEMEESFSDTAINKMCYVKLKNQKYIDKAKILFEFYTTNLFSLIAEAKQNKDFDLDKDVESFISDFVKCFKKGKLNTEISNYLADISKGLIAEYLSLGYKDDFIFVKNEE